MESSDRLFEETKNRNVEISPENKQPEAMKVFLGGTCAESKWRDLIIPQLKCNYFNPVVKDWTPECQENEKREKTICDYHLYVITPKMKGVFSIAEAVNDSKDLPEGRCVFCVTKEGDDRDWDTTELKSLNAVAGLIADNGGAVVRSLDEVVTYLNNEHDKSLEMNLDEELEELYDGVSEELQEFLFKNSEEHIDTLTKLKAPQSIIDSYKESVNRRRKQAELYKILKPALLKRFGGNKREALRAFLNKDFSNLDLSGLSFTGYDLRDADFSESRIHNCKFDQTDLQNANFGNCFITETSFCEAKLLKANLSYSIIDKSNFESANLAKTVIWESTIGGCNFESANLTNSSFYGSEIKECDFRKTNLTETEFFDASISASAFSGAKQNHTKYSLCSIENCLFANVPLYGLSGLLTPPKELAELVPPKEMSDRLADLGIPRDIIDRVSRTPGLVYHIGFFNEQPSDFSLMFNGKNFQIKNPYTGKDMGEAISVIEDHNRRNPNKGLELSKPEKKKADTKQALDQKQDNSFKKSK